MVIMMEFYFNRTEQQKNSCLAEMNDMRAAVEEINMEKVFLNSPQTYQNTMLYKILIELNSTF